jgi:alkylated DNA repair dioxygenase AlkB
MSKYYTSTINNINVHYHNDFLDKQTSDKYFNIFESNIVYNSDEESQITMFGKKMNIPRQQVAYGDKGTSYKFAGVKVMAIPWNDDNVLSKTLLEIKTKVEEKIGKKFNFVLINKYKNGDSYIGAHRDDEKELGHNPSIACVSFGCERPIIFAPYKFIPIKDTLILSKEKLSIPLKHGSLCVMLDTTNTYWTHTIPKNYKLDKPRISLTFRYIHM